MMISSRKLLPTLLLCSLLSRLAGQQATILYTNDIESVYEPVKAFWNDDIDYIGGIPQLTTLIKQIREQESTSFLLDAGDIFTGTLCKATGGKLAFDIYSAMGYDAMALGNHEFEYGWQQLREVMYRARFPVLSANLFYAGTEIPFGRPYAILEKNGIRLGVIGIIGVDAFNNTTMLRNRKGLEVRPPAPIVRELATRLRPEVDLLIVLTHQNRTAPMQTDKEVDPEVQRGFEEDYELAGAVPGIDMVIGGHSDHGLWQPVRHDSTGAYIGLTFGQGKYLGYAKFDLSQPDQPAALTDGRLIPVRSNELLPDPTVSGLIARARSEYPDLSDTISYLESQAFRKYYRESNIGNLMADIVRLAAEADVAMMGSGSLRFDLNPGPVTVEEISNVFPFTDRLAVVKVTGAELIEVLEYSYSLSYGLAQFSGLQTEYDSRRPAGQRLLSLKVAGLPVESTKTYRLATYSYAATGGDGYDMLRNKEVTESTESLTEILVDYFRRNKKVSPPPLGRQVDLARTKP